MNKIAIKVYTPRTVAQRSRYLFVSECHFVTYETDDPITNLYNEIYQVITLISTPEMEQHILRKFGVNVQTHTVHICTASVVIA
jgi:hypothetical protein